MSEPTEREKFLMMAQQQGVDYVSILERKYAALKQENERLRELLGDCRTAIQRQKKVDQVFRGNMIP